MVSGYPSPTTAGGAHNVTVTAQDAFGNVATGYTGTVHFTSSDASAVLPANYTFTGGDAGTHVFSVTLKTAGTQSITATDTVTGTITGTQSGITVHSAAGHHPDRLGLHQSDHGRGGPQRHGDGPGRLRQRGDRLHRHGPLHQQRRPGRSCRPTTPSPAATPGPTSSRCTLKTAGTQSITATDTVTGSITGLRVASR